MINIYTKCHRDSCFGYCKGQYTNNCSVLTEVYGDNQKCQFYKRNKNEINKTRIKAKAGK